MIFKDIKFQYEGVLEFDFKEINISNKITNIVGQNGVGKSTFINLLLQKSLSEKLRVSYIHQNYRQNWVWWVSVMENFDLSVNSRNKYDYKNSDLWLENKDFIDFVIKKDIPIYTKNTSGIDVLPLSGGQIQRLIFIRELLCIPEFLFLDEAFSAIDKENKLFLMNQLVKWQEKYNFQIINISHTKKDLEILGGDVLHLTRSGNKVEIEKLSLEKFKKTTYYDKMA